MLKAISLWLHNTTTGKIVLTMLLSMMPVGELRVGLPAGVALGLPIPAAMFFSILGNMIPVPFVILFIRKIFKWIRVHIPKLDAMVDRLEARAYEKMQNKQLVRYEVWGLLAFVAIPLPGTGAWTGSLIAALMDLRLKNAMPVIFVGVIIAALIVTAVTYGVTALL
jgi:uncharacterized membrane protein